MNVHFVDLSQTIRVQHHLWEKTVKLEFALDYMAKPWQIEKIFINGSPISERDLSRKLSSFNTLKPIQGKYELQIEKRK